MLKEINKLKGDDEVTVYKENEELVFRGKTDLFSLKELEANSPVLYKSQLTPLDNILLRFGTATIICQFSEKGETTEVLVEMTSSKTPGFFWRLFIKLTLFIMKIQSRSDEKLYIKAIEESA